MAQGTRGRWLRVAATGFGVVLCTGLVGCLHDDKAKDTKVGAKQQGLPGTPKLDGPAGQGGIAKNGQPGYPNNGFPPNGSSNIQQPGGLQPAGAGMGTGQYRNNNGLNTNNGTVPQQNFGGPAGVPGGGAMNGTPSLPGAYNPGIQPLGGPVAPSQYGGVAPVGGGVASPPNLLDVPLPPPPPLNHGSEFGAGTGGIVSPPSSAFPVAPPAPPPGATGKGPPLSPTYPN